MATVVTPEEEVATTPPVSPAATRLPAPEAPEGTRPLRVFWGFTTVIVAIHLLSLLALVPWFFSWTGVVLLHSRALCVRHAGHQRSAITACSRIAASRARSGWSMRWPCWASAACRTRPRRWVAVHRKHHQHSDEEPDPHSPLVSVLLGPHGLADLSRTAKPARSTSTSAMSRDLLSRSVLHAAGTRRAAGLDLRRPRGRVLSRRSGDRLASDGPLLAAACSSARACWCGACSSGPSCVWHITWCVNSLTHIWGYRNYETGDNSRNNWLVGLRHQRRRLAQQPPRRPADRRARPSLVGIRPHLARDPTAWSSSAWRRTSCGRA